MAAFVLRATLVSTQSAEGKKGHPNLLKGCRVWFAFLVGESACFEKASTRPRFQPLPVPGFGTIFAQQQTMSIRLPPLQILSHRKPKTKPSPGEAFPN